MNPFLFPTGNGGSVSTLGAYASPPGAPSEGDVHISNDGPISRFWNGSSWDDFVPGVGPITAPPSSGWSAVNGATVPSVSGGTLKVIDSADSGNTPWIQRNAPSAPYTVKTLIREEADGTVPGVGFYEKGTGKAVYLYYTTAQTIVVIRESTLGVTFSSVAITSAARVNGGLGGYQTRLKDDNTTLYWQISSDGQNWSTMWSELRGSFFTTAPDATCYKMATKGSWSMIDYTEA